jgi:outer membrane protein OmpA-like peptidoglycan-associated protein
MSTRIVSLAISVLAAACSNVPPPRPVPPAEGTRNLPGWYPQAAWSADAANARVYLEGKIVFDTGKARIRPESEKVLNDLLAYLSANPDITRVRLEGHTDSRAAEEYNQDLSARRAIAVADWLVDHGLDHNRIVAVAFGELRPLWPNQGPTAMQENRRTAFHVAEVSGNRFRGEDPTSGGLVLDVKSKEQREADKLRGKVPDVKPPPVRVELDIIRPVEDKVIRDPLDEPEAPEPEPGKKSNAPAAKDASSAN